MAETIETLIVETIMKKGNLPEVSKVISKSIDNVGFAAAKTTTSVQTLNNGIVTQSKSTTTLTQGLKKFKFEWLGVMFAGMAIARVFGGIIRKQAELWGISEGLSALWAIVMAPAMAYLSEWFWILFDVITSQSDAVLFLIGMFIAFAAAIGTVMMIVGQFMLGLHSMFMVIPKLAVVFSKLGLVWKGLAALASAIGLPIIAVIAIITTIVIGMYLAWKSNFLGMKEVVSKFIAGFKQFFSGIYGYIKGILMILKGLFTGDFELIKEGIVLVFQSLWKILLGGFKMTFNAIKAIAIGALKIVYNIIKAIIDGIGWAVGKIGGFMGIGGGEPAWKMPSLQTGGIVQETGPHLLHKGETVIPAGGGGMTFNTTVNANVSSDYDVKRLADELSSELAVNFERKLKMRGSI